MNRKRKHQTEVVADTVHMLAVYDGAPIHCVGFLYPRNKQGVEAYDADNRNLGIFPNQKMAADAVALVARDVA